MQFARIGIFETDGWPVDPIVTLFRERVSPEFEGLDGFLGYQAFVEAGGSRYVGISYWSSMAALEASEAVAGAARMEASRLGARVVGAPIIVRQAFDSRNGSAQELPEVGVN